MEYLFEFNGATYQLPAFTISVKKDISKIDAQNENTAIGDETKYKTMVDFEKKILGADTVKEIFGTDNFEEMDLSKITICYLGIVLAYDKPTREYKREINGEKVDLNTIEQFESLAKSADTIIRAAEKMNKK